MIGKTLGHYQIKDRIGAGGMGEVYRAHDLVLGRDVALKILPEEMASNPQGRARFEQEARAVAALSHPNILEIHDFGTDGDTVYAVTELLEGETLRAHLERGPLSPQKGTDFAFQIASGLAAAHNKGIVHRDLKPENVFVTHDGRIKILDFGLARVMRGEVLGLNEASDTASTELRTTSGMILGTVGYMAPEQVRGEVVDARSDIFAFGVVLYELLTGSRAFNKGTAIETLNSILNEDPLETSPAWNELSQEMQRIISRCLSKDPSERFQSTADLAFAIGTASGSRKAPAVSPAAREGVDAARPLAKSIAVLPFTNMSADRENEYLSDGLTEEIINALVQVPGITVAARSSSFAFKGTSPDIREVAAKLGVTTVLEGSVRRAGGRVRVTAQLINAADGHHLWSTRLDRDADDLLAIQDEIATTIAGKLEATLGGKAPEVLSRPMTGNPEAFDLYLKGRFYMERRGEDLRQGLEFFEKAVELDPGFAAAHAGVAEGYTVRGFYGFSPPREVMPKAKAAARKAMALDENNAAAHAVLAFVTMLYDWDWKAAESGLERAIELDPRNTNTRCWYGLYSLLCVRGLVDKALAECERAIEIDPVDTFPLAILGTALYTARRYDEALPYLLEVVGRSPGSYAGWRILGLIHLARSSHLEATKALERAVEFSGRNPWPLAELGIVYAASGRPADAQALYDELRVRTEDSWISPVCRALLSMALGRLDEAFSHLDRAYRERDSLLIGFRQWPLLDPLRADPRYDQLITKIGFEPVRGGIVQREAAPLATNSPFARKMVVVLPFENLGPSEEDYFAAGITEEITSRLAEISDLGVISRTSAVQYDRSGKTIREIGQDLGAGYVLEGTVRWDQRAGSRVRITPQLIRVSDDTHIWAERYDRVLDDIFAVQSEIARKVISHLEANLLEGDRRALASQPTENLEAYQAYLRGLSHTSEASISEEDIRLAIKMFERAVELDPSFSQAHARMALDHSSMYVFGYDMTPERIAMTKEAAGRAQVLAPGSYHAHMAQGYYFYRCAKDYELALVEFGKAAERRPNDAALWASMSYIQRRRGNWEESIGQLKKSLELDPQNAVRFGQLGISLRLTRDYERAEEAFERSISLHPDQDDSYIERAANFWRWNGYLDRAAAVLASAPVQNSRRIELAWYFQDLFCGNWESALNRVTPGSTEVFIVQEGYFPKPLLAYWCHVRMGQKKKAEKSAVAALAMLESAAKENPTDARVLCSLGQILANLGRGSEAIRAGERAVELSPMDKDVLAGAMVLVQMAQIRANAGDAEAALDLVEHLLAIPSELSPAMLRLDPAWDPLRGNLRFEELGRAQDSSESPS